MNNNGNYYSRGGLSNGRWSCTASGACVPNNYSGEYTNLNSCINSCGYPMYPPPFVNDPSPCFNETPYTLAIQAAYNPYLQPQFVYQPFPCQQNLYPSLQPIYQPVFVPYPMYYPQSLLYYNRRSQNY